MKGMYPDAKSAKGGGGTRMNRMGRTAGSVNHKGTQGRGHTTPKAKGTQGNGSCSHKAKGVQGRG